MEAHKLRPLAFKSSMTDFDSSETREFRDVSWEQQDEVILLNSDNDWVSDTSLSGSEVIVVDTDKELVNNSLCECSPEIACIDCVGY